MLNHVLDYAVLYYKILNIMKGYTIQSNNFSIFLSLKNLNLPTLNNNNGI
jgi:hypothetical protein